MSFRDWSGWRILALVFAWVVAMVVLVPWPTPDTIQGFDERGQLFLSGTSFDPVAVIKFVGWAVLPPLLLLVAWRVQRRP